MTQVEFYKSNDRFYEFKTYGHAGYALGGNDIVCSAISALSQALIIGLEEVIGAKIYSEVQDGYVNVIVQSIESISKMGIAENSTLGKSIKSAKAQVLFETIYLSLKEIEQQYPENLKITVYNSDESDIDIIE